MDDIGLKQVDASPLKPAQAYVQWLFQSMRVRATDDECRSVAKALLRLAPAKATEPGGFQGKRP